jgi:hypothetical protein
MAEYTCCSSVAFERPNENTFAFLRRDRAHCKHMRHDSAPEQWPSATYHVVVGDDVGQESKRNAARGHGRRVPGTCVGVVQAPRVRHGGLHTGAGAGPTQDTCHVVLHRPTVGTGACGARGRHGHTSTPTQLRHTDQWYIVTSTLSAVVAYVVYLLDSWQCFGNLIEVHLHLLFTRCSLQGRKQPSPPRPQGR